MKKIYKLSAFIILSVFVACAVQKPSKKPTLFLIGDSTVKNGQDKGDGGLWGWGHFLPDFFDLNKINVENHALGGTSTRTFRSKGLWDSVLVKIKPGDYVMMQFGHNDSSPLDDTARARGTIKGNADDSQEIYNPILKKQERVYSYGWYIRQFIRETKAKGGIPIVCSLIPRNSWNYNARVNRSEYVEWARAAAIQENAFYINLNKLIADEYDKIGEAKVNQLYFGPKDHTHTIKEGAIFNAQKVVEGIKTTNGLKLAKYLK
jgi:lysophospholipase L1-like esterase|nr:rhamnogalacturonan acetylesterase [uncultured Pedobacter sp.]